MEREGGKKGKVTRNRDGQNERGRGRERRKVIDSKRERKERHKH